MSPLPILTLVFGASAIVAVYLTIRSFRARHHVRGTLGSLATLALLALTALTVVLSIATRGLRPLTREETAARVEVRPLPDREHAFEATIDLPNTPERTFEVRGDQLYVDAQIVKWEPWVNVLGLHTSYELDRLGGRYRDPKLEKNAPRTVHPLGQQRYIEVPELLDRVPVLGRLVDAKYGSATYVDVDRPRKLEVRVSTTGLLMREADGDSSSER